MSTEPLRHIAHLDMDAFYASVELLRYPELRGKPVVIGGGRRHQPEGSLDPATGQIVRRFHTLRGYVGRGVVTTATYEARALGLHSSQPLMTAGALAPGAILLPVDLDDIPRRIWPLPARKINGVGPKSSAKLGALGIHTIGDLAAADPLWLIEQFGKNYGAWLHEAAHGRDERKIVTNAEPKSISRELT